MSEENSSNKNNKRCPEQVSDSDYNIHFLIKITIVGILSFVFIHLSNTGIS